MMHTATVDGINDLLHDACQAVLTKASQATVRGSKTWELHPAVYEILDPTDRTLLYPYRGNNPFAALFETIWLFGSPDNNITTLAKFIPRALDYTDDGISWRAGYPNRLRRFGAKKIDQIQYIFDKLREDRSSRQAVIVLWNPEDDCYKSGNSGELQKSNDFPCSNYLHFMIRDEKLDCTFVIRSNDAIFGMTGINLYEFTVLQEILAMLLGTEIGKFYYIADSLHLYEEHKEKALKISSWHPFNYGLPRFSFRSPSYLWEDYQVKMNKACMYISNDVVPINSTDGETFSDMIKLCQAFLVYHDQPPTYFESFCADMKRITFSDLHVACMFWFMKHWKMLPDVTQICKAIEVSSVNSIPYIQSD